MFKWIALAIGVLILTVFVVKIIKTMLKVEKESNKADHIEQPVDNNSEYTTDEAPINLHSSTSSIMTDMSSTPIDKLNSVSDYDLDMPTGFTDDLDEEFGDYSSHMRSRKGRRRHPVDFDLDGEMADDFEYMPSSPDFSYLHNRRQPSKQLLNKSLNELSTELKVLMLSDIFDRKF